MCRAATQKRNCPQHPEGRVTSGGKTPHWHNSSDVQRQRERPWTQKTALTQRYIAMLPFSGKGEWLTTHVSATKRSISRVFSMTDQLLRPPHRTEILSEQNRSCLQREHKGGTGNADTTRNLLFHHYCCLPDDTDTVLGDNVHRYK